MEQVDAALVEEERGVRGPRLAPAVPLEERHIERRDPDEERHAEGRADRDALGEIRSAHQNHGGRTRRRRKKTSPAPQNRPTATRGVFSGVDA